MLVANFGYRNPPCNFLTAAIIALLIAYWYCCPFHGIQRIAQRIGALLLGEGGCTAGGSGGASTTDSAGCAHAERRSALEWAVRRHKLHAIDAVDQVVLGLQAGTKAPPPAGGVGKVNSKYRSR